MIQVFQGSLRLRRIILNETSVVDGLSGLLSECITKYCEQRGASFGNTLYALSRGKEPLEIVCFSFSRTA